MQPLLWWPRVVIWKSVVGGGAISLCFFSFMSLGEDHIACVAADIDNIAEINIGVVERIIVMLMTIISFALMSESSHLIADPAVLVEIHFLLLVLNFDGDCYAWRSGRRIMADSGFHFCCHYWTGINAVGRYLSNSSKL